MPYPSRPVLEPLEEFKGSATVRQSPEQRARLLAFAAEQYVAGRSLRQIAELTDRTQTVLCTSQARLHNAEGHTNSPLVCPGIASQLTFCASHGPPCGTVDEWRWALKGARTHPRAEGEATWLLPRTATAPSAARRFE